MKWPPWFWAVVTIVFWQTKIYSFVVWLLIIFDTIYTFNEISKLNKVTTIVNKCMYIDLSHDMTDDLYFCCRDGAATASSSSRRPTLTSPLTRQPNMTDCLCVKAGGGGGGGGCGGCGCGDGGGVDPILPPLPSPHTQQLAAATTWKDKFFSWLLLVISLNEGERFPRPGLVVIYFLFSWLLIYDVL